MKKLFLSITLLLAGLAIHAQQVRELDEINENNSWLKLGINLGAPIGDVGNYSSFALGLDFAAQFMRTDNFGFGVASGYTKYFEKSDAENYDGLNDGFGAIPLGFMFRYYPQPVGFFVGTDVGYSFLTSVNSADGGAYIRPQLGYHNYDWNIFGYYNQVFRADPAIDVQSIGVAVTYNIRFK